MLKRRLSAVAATAAAAALVLTGCTSGGEATDDSGLGGDGGGALTFSDVEILKTYNGEANNSTLYDNQALFLLQDGFYYYDADLNVQRDTDFGTYEMISEDPQVVQYTIGADRNWSDGQPVTATDLYLTWAALSGNFNTSEADDAETDEDTGEITNQDELGVFFNASSPGVSFIESGEISEDDKTVTFTYSEPFADWETNFQRVVLPSHVVGQHALDIEDPTAARDAVREAISTTDNTALAEISDFWNSGFNFGTQLPEDPSLYLSNGRFTLTDWQQDQFQTFEAVEDYPGANPAGIQTLTVRKIEDPQASVQALQNNEIQAFSTTQVDVDLVQGAEGLGDGFEVVQGEAGSYGHIDLAFTGGGAFDPASYGGDEATALAVRQAFLKVFPRQDLVDRLVVPLNPEATLRNSFSQIPGSPWYDAIAAANGLADYTEPDVEGAQQLLEDAGVETPINVRFLFSNQSNERAEQYAIAAQALEDSGLFTAEDNSSADWSTLLSDTTVYDATFFGWISTSTAVTESDANFRTGAVNNRQGYSNPQVDTLLDELAVETDPAEQERILTEVETLVTADAFGYPFAQSAQLTAFNNTVSGINPSPISPGIYWNPWEWSVN